MESSSVEIFFGKKGGVVLSGRKAELAEKAYYAWKLKLEVAKTAQDDMKKMTSQAGEKTVDNGIWFCSPLSR